MGWCTLWCDVPEGCLVQNGKLGNLWLLQPMPIFSTWMSRSYGYYEGKVHWIPKFRDVQRWSRRSKSVLSCIQNKIFLNIYWEYMLRKYGSKYSYELLSEVFFTEHVDCNTCASIYNNMLTRSLHITCTLTTMYDCNYRPRHSQCGWIRLIQRMYVVPKLTTNPIYSIYDIQQYATWSEALHTSSMSIISFCSKSTNYTTKIHPKK